MRVSALLLVVLVSLPSSSAFAASYQHTDGSIVDPILYNVDFDPGLSAHPYSGLNLEPGANLPSINLQGANLASVNLNGANLSGSDFNGAWLLLADLRNASLREANLSSVPFFAAELEGADFSGADLSGAYALAHSFGSPRYDAATNFSGAWSFGTGGHPDDTPFDPVAAGWTLVPEPSTALLLGLGLTALAVRRGG